MSSWCEVTVLVTGAGLIGSLAANLLAASGRDVVICDIRDTAPELADSVEYCHCDCLDYRALDDLVSKRKVREIIHTAAVLSSGMRADPRSGLHVNFQGMVNILELARKHDSRRVVNASSTTVLYSGFGSLPSEPIDEDVPLRLLSQRPASLYAITKLASEQLCLHYRDAYGVSTVSLRFAAVLGGDIANPSSVPGRLLKRLVDASQPHGKAILNDPLLTWAGTEEFIDARDCARAIIAALDADNPATGVYNIAAAPAVSFDQFLETFRTEIGDLDLEIPIEPSSGFAGFPFIRPAPSATERAEREFGFKPEYSLADSIRYWANSVSK